MKNLGFGRDFRVACVCVCVRFVFGKGNTELRLSFVTLYGFLIFFLFKDLDLGKKTQTDKSCNKKDKQQCDIDQAKAATPHSC